MDLKIQIQQDLKIAVKEREELKSLVLRSILAAILNKEKEKRYQASREKQGLTEEELEKESQLTDEDTGGVVFSEAKKRKEAILEFGKGQRQDLAEKEKKELEIMEKYLPEQITEKELEKLAREAIDKTAAQGMKDIGKVMSELMPKVKGRADGNLVSKVIKELLNG